MVPIEKSWERFKILNHQGFKTVEPFAHIAGLQRYPHLQATRRHFNAGGTVDGCACPQGKRILSYSYTMN